MSTPDAEATPQSIEQQLAALPPEERAAAMAQMLEQLMAQPLMLPMQWAITPVNTGNGPGVLIELRCQAGTFRNVVLRNDAMALANEITKTAMMGPKLQIAQPGDMP